MSKDMKQKSYVGWICVVLIMAALGIGAAVTNPSEEDGEKLIKTELTHRVHDYLAEQETTGMAELLAQRLAMTFSDKLIEYGLDIDVKNYFLFSTFEISAKDFDLSSFLPQGNVEVNNEEIGRKKIKGILLFGQIIPFNVPRNKQELQEFLMN